MLRRLVEVVEQERRDYGLEKQALEQQLGEQAAALDDLDKQIGAAEEVRAWLLKFPPVRGKGLSLGCHSLKST